MEYLVKKVATEFFIFFLFVLKRKTNVELRIMSFTLLKHNTKIEYIMYGGSVGMSVGVSQCIRCIKLDLNLIEKPFVLGSVIM